MQHKFALNVALALVTLLEVVLICQLENELLSDYFKVVMMVGVLTITYLTAKYLSTLKKEKHLQTVLAAKHVP